MVVLGPKKSHGKVHLPLVNQVVLALETTFLQGTFADKVLEKIFKAQRQLGARDRRFIAECFYDAVRWWRLLGEQLGHGTELQKNEIEERVFLLLHSKGFEVPEKFQDRFEKVSPPSAYSRAVRESFSDWLDQLAEKELGPRWESIAKALNETASVDLRANTLKVSKKDLRLQLSEADIDAVSITEVEDGLTLKERQNIFGTEAFQKGFFEVQDRASQRVAPLLKVEPGMRVVDACAGAGGKSLHLAALMKNKGKILSLDIYQWKLDELKTRSKRAGVDIIEPRLIEGTKTIKRLAETCDRLLLDVPCTGIGVLRRNPDKKWKLTFEELERMRALQREILKDYSKMVKPAGLMVYATCSFLPSENRDQVDWFLQEHPDWSLEEEIKIFPDEGRGDGFYGARLRRV